jgi:hypothetical protein
MSPVEERLAAACLSAAFAIEEGGARIANALRDIAEAVGRSGEKSSQPIRDRIANLVEENGDLSRVQAQRIRGAS